MNNKPGYHKVHHPLQEAFEHFNKTLFDGDLPETVVLVQREAKTKGYFSPQRWVDPDSGEKLNEIALNSAYFGCTKLVAILAVLVHQMVHEWQHCKKEGGNTYHTYHNKEWAEKMAEVGLQATDDGTQSGKKTGQKMSEMPIENGVFVESCLALLRSGFKLNLIDLVMSSMKIEDNAKPLQYKPLPDEMSDISDALVETSSEFNISSDEDDTDNNETIETEESKFSELPSQDSMISMNDISNLKVLDTVFSDVVPSVHDNAQIKDKREGDPSKISYICQCEDKPTQIWGKPNIQVKCTQCNELFIPKKKN